VYRLEPPEQGAQVHRERAGTVHGAVWPPGSHTHSAPIRAAVTLLIWMATGSRVLAQ